MSAQRFPAKVAVVTDSTASLPAEIVAARGVTVVPLRVVVGTTSYDEGVPGSISAQMLAEALRARTPVSTSRPNPEEMLRTYEALASAGAHEIVAVHLSGDLSGTYESAQLAASRSPVQVTVVDSRQVGMGTGFAVLAALDALDDGADGPAAAQAARNRASSTTSLFYVDTLEYLRRGGRIGAVGALVGSALAVKPILALEDGRVVPFERVRTANRALSRLEELAVQAAGDAPVDLAVSHLASPQRAEELARAVGGGLADSLEGRQVHVGEIGAVLGAHVGPGMVAVVVSRRE
jgi:DegV family protein with EDD domain